MNFHAKFAQENATMTRVLVTGFGPFPGAPENPSAQIVTRLARERLPGHLLASYVFPTSYRDVDRDLPSIIGAFRPKAVVMFGLAATTAHMRIETLAHNEISRHVDATGYTPASAIIRAPGATALRGRAPFARLVQAARAAGVKADLSDDAGRYVCNYIYWRAIEAIRKPGGPRSAVFVHVPELRTGPDGLSLPKLVRAARAIVLAAVENLPAR